MKVGKHSYFAQEPNVISFVHVGEPEPEIEIGAYCSIAAGVEFLPGGIHNMDSVSTFPWHRLDTVASYQYKLRGPIIIGNDVWIGHGVKILGGVTIGDGAILGAWSVVAKDVPPYYLAVGNPAVSYMRHSFGQAAILQQIAWWEWDDDDPRMDDVKTLSVDQFLDKHWYGAQ